MASVSPTKSAAEARAFYDLKQRAKEYYSANGVPHKIEEILNSMFYENPDDVYGHLSNYFEGLAKPPVISKLIAREVLDSRAQQSMQTEVFCVIKNNEKLVATTTSSSSNEVPDSKPEEKEAEDEERQKSVAAAIEYVQKNISEALSQVNPTDQEKVDNILLGFFKKLKEEEDDRLAKEREELGAAQTPELGAPSPAETSSQTKQKGQKSPKGKGKAPAVVIIPDEPKEKLVCGCNAVSAVSQSVCMAAAGVSDVPLYEHIAKLRHGEVPEVYHLPLPMVTMLCSGKALHGKLNCVKEFMVVPKPGMAFRESVKHIVNIYNYLGKTISSKAGGGKGKPASLVAKNTNDTGGLCPQLDRPEQGLDMIQEAITSIGLSPGEDFHIALHCAGPETFDYEKGKYEVITGQQKAPEDLVEFWSELLGRYPSVIALIDPMRKQEKESWMKLCERISERCYIVGESVFHRPGILKDEELAEDFKASGVTLCLEKMTTVTDLLQAAKKMEDADYQVVLSTSQGDSPDSFLADMAVGMNAKFLRVGGPLRGERVSKLNRLAQIEANLEQSGRLSARDAHVFPFIKPPTPPPEEENQEETAPSSDVKK